MQDFEPPAFGGKFAAFVISEAMALRSRQNYLVSLGKTLKVGEVARIEPDTAIDLTTTADIALGDTAISAIADTTGLIEGQAYSISGIGIPKGATFIFDGADGGAQRVKATATTTDLAVVISAPAGVGPWLTSFIAGDAEVNLRQLIFPPA